MITMENVTMKYSADKVALKDVNINIEKGEFVFVVGSSGSGKTTFIKLLTKELNPTKGKISVAGYNYNKIRRRQIPKVRRKIGVVFQNFRLLNDRTVYENVAFAQRVIETPSRYIRKQVPAVLTMVELADRYKAYPRQLSGGEQQRVAIARAIVNKPDIILADEPTGALDSQTGRLVMDIFHKLHKEQGKTIVLITHSPELAEECERIITLKDGHVVGERAGSGAPAFAKAEEEVSVS